MPYQKVYSFLCALWVFEWYLFPEKVRNGNENYIIDYITKSKARNLNPFLHAWKCWFFSTRFYINGNCLNLSSD